MAEIIETCPIWGNRYKAKGTFNPAAKMYEVEDSDRTFSGYKVSQLLLSLRVKRLSDREKAWLTTWIVDQFNLGNYQPEITPHMLESVLRKRSLRVYQRADRLLKYIAIAMPMFIQRPGESGRRRHPGPRRRPAGPGQPLSAGTRRCAGRSGAGGLAPHAAGRLSGDGVCVRGAQPVRCPHPQRRYPGSGIERVGRPGNLRRDAGGRGAGALSSAKVRRSDTRGNGGGQPPP